ncbi:MAG: ATP-binding protein [Planctomycetales bacterium]|nr:ATP-binding protein [Planctomycetales bacterium]
MHPLLERQLRRAFGGAIPGGEAFARWTEAVDRFYRESDEDRALLERSLDLASHELLEKNRLLRDDNERLRAAERALLEGERRLREMNDQLEARVAERTRRLEETNQDLRREIGQREAAEKQLRQAQKMEAIGLLAGGIAHDINNQLSGVLGFAGLAQAALSREHPAHSDLARVQEAGEKAAGIARQLLAFSRKQVLEPRVVDPHDVVAQTERMLGRLLGEDISIAVVRRGRPVRTRVDPGQLEQAVMNLAINARDAMPGGGRITIETGGEELDEAAAALRPGPYARIVVQDTGHGMDRETLTRIFEPFFTTKPVGKGTGLGLAMVHGFVHQSEGFIEVESAPGAGTTFRLWFPAVRDDGPRAEGGRPAEAVLPRGTESVLVVEDDALVRLVAVRILQGCGYRVSESANGPAALQSLRSGPPPDLLLSDVVMPGLSGVEFAEEARALHPRLRVCFMSGYPRDDVQRRGIFTAGDRFVPKPLTPATLARAVRETLDKV